MFHIRLKQDWKGTFRRTVERDEEGGSLRVREFTPGEVVQVPAAEIPYLAFDVGKALQAVEWSNEFRKFRPVEDFSKEDLEDLVEDIKAGRYKEQPIEEPQADPGPQPEAEQKAAIATGEESRASLVDASGAVVSLPVGGDVKDAVPLPIEPKGEAEADQKPGQQPAGESEQKTARKKK